MLLKLITSSLLILTLALTYANGQSAPLRNAPAPNQAVIRLTPIYQASVASDRAPFFAIVRNADGEPQLNIPVNFMITGGPDMGTSHIAFTDCAGRAMFDYSSDQTGSETTLIANFFDSASGALINSQESEFYVFSLPNSADTAQADAVAQKAAARAAGRLTEANAANGLPMSVAGDVMP